MSVEILDSATIISFLEDEEAFNSSIKDQFAHNSSIKDQFAHLDTNHDGLLSYEEMLKELQSLRVFETHFGIDVKVSAEELATTYGAMFHQFDHDLNGAVDVEEFKAETKRMMLAVANGLGFLPIQMVLEKDSLLKKAVELELAKIVA